MKFGSKNVAAMLKSRPLSARMLGEYHAARLNRSSDTLEYRACVESARPGTLAIDVGANVGHFSLGMSRSVGLAGHVLAFEPQPDVFEDLRRTVWGSRVTPLNLAVSDSTGIATLTVPMTQSGEVATQLGSLELSTSSDGSTNTDMVVRIVRLDDVVGQGKPVSLLKIDVEGHEAQVLSGATELIEKWRPRIVVEIEQRHLHGSSVHDVVTSITDLGYQCDFFGRGTRLPFSAFETELDQTRWLDGNESLKPTTTGADYGNNFIFTSR